MEAISATSLGTTTSLSSLLMYQVHSEGLLTQVMLVKPKHTFAELGPKDEGC